MLLTEDRADWRVTIVACDVDGPGFYLVRTAGREATHDAVIVYTQEDHAALGVRECDHFAGHFLGVRRTNAVIAEPDFLELGPRIFSGLELPSYFFQSVEHVRRVRINIRSGHVAAERPRRSLP